MDAFVSVDWLATHREDSDLVVVDVRDGWEFDGIGHVPGAVNVPFERFRAGGSDGDGKKAGDGDAEPAGMLPGEGVWERLLSAAGVGPEDRLVSYDDTHGVFAARFAVTALLYGHPPERLAALDGDYSAWSRTHETTTEATAVTGTTYEVDRPADSPLVGFETVRTALGEPGTVVLDTREPREYAEGHLPGAAQLDWMALVDDESRGLRPREAAESVLADRGVDRDSRVVLYCNTARRISHTYLALRQFGYESVDFYEGSLTEWEARGGPVETGAD